ncbi:MAG: hypothetical protein M1828_001973 [Chrysothrix sp. TS-e1954]|nr:MAG: hypothetical protein M1828_001973 [Chrysothrix sp. TS-e1954]
MASDSDFVSSTNIPTTSDPSGLPVQSSDAPQSSQNAQTDNNNSTVPQEASSTLDSEGRPARKRSLVDSSASPGQVTSKSTDSESQPVDSAQPRRLSKRGSLEKKRPGSQGSTRSLKGHNGTDNKQSATEKANSEVRPKKKGVSRLLSILCCTSGEASSSSDEQPSKAARPQPAQGTQSVPMTRLEPGGRENANSDANKANQESRPAPDNTTATSSTPEGSKPASAQPVGAGTVNRATDPPSDSAGGVPGDRTSRLDKPLPVSPATSGAIGGADLTSPQPGNGGQATNQTSQTQTAPMAARQENVISDRTPQQKQTDEDIEMTDVGPSVPLAAADIPGAKDENQPPLSTADRSGPVKVDIPPPPPTSERQLPPQLSENTAVATAPIDDQKCLLPKARPEHVGRKCLVLDLDETLVHSSFKILHQADFTIPVEIEGQYHNVYVIKRPGVDQFMKRVGELYEVVVFTASVSKYGDPLLDQLDIHHVVHHRLFRESCYNHNGNYVKDLSQVGRELKDTIIIDNSPTSYIFHPQHAVPISSWFSDAHDNELLDLIPVLEDLAGDGVQDVSLVLDVGL